MKRFLRNVIFFFSVQALVFALLWARFDLDAEANYLAATIDKHRRLAGTAGPRLILVGGSNVALGLRSDRLEEALGRPVVNMAVAIGLGLDYMLNEVVDAVGAGDVVVLSPEYELLSGYYNIVTLQQAVAYSPENIRYLNYNQIVELASEYGLALVCEFVRRAVYIDKDESRNFAREQFPYSRHGFDSRGDFTTHYGLPSTNMPPVLEDSEEPQIRSRLLPESGILKRLSEFAERCRRKGATVAYTFPPRPTEDWRSEAPTAEAIFNALEDAFGITFIDRPGDQLYPRAQFFDSTYHLSEEGASRRTDRLIESLQRYVTGSPAEGSRDFVKSRSQM